MISRENYLVLQKGKKEEKRGRERDTHIHRYNTDGKRKR